MSGSKSAPALGSRSAQSSVSKFANASSSKNQEATRLGDDEQKTSFDKATISEATSAP